MDDKRCGTCRHWGDPAEPDGFPFASCLRIKLDMCGESYQKGNNGVTIRNSVFDDAAVVVSDGGYHSTLRTREHFCCSLWQPLPAPPEAP